MFLQQIAWFQIIITAMLQQVTGWQLITPHPNEASGELLPTSCFCILLPFPVCKYCCPHCWVELSEPLHVLSANLFINQSLLIQTLLNLLYAQLSNTHVPFSPI